MAIINDKLKHFGKFDKSNIKLQPKCFFVLSYDCCKCSRNCFQWIHITKSFSAPGFDEAFKYKKQHIAAKDFSRRFRTIIQGYEERVWMEFDTNFIKLPKPFEYVVYDCFGRVFVSSSKRAALLFTSTAQCASCWCAGVAAQSGFTQFYRQTAAYLIHGICHFVEWNVV